MSLNTEPFTEVFTMVAQAAASWSRTGDAKANYNALNCIAYQVDGRMPKGDRFMDDVAQLVET